MMTPLEMEKLEFDTKLGGYKRDSVDSVFQVVKSDYEKIYKENIELRDKISVLEELVSKYKNMEDTMQNAIILAQQSADSAVAAAREKAEAIMKEAEARAIAYESEQVAKREGLKSAISAMEKEVTIFAAEKISMLQAQIEILNKMKSDALAD